MFSNDLFRFHHIGIAVKDFANSLAFYQSLGYSYEGPIVDTLQKAELLILSSATGPRIELIKPYGDESSVRNYLKREDTAIYHLCYEVTNLDTAAKELKKETRALCVSSPRPAVLFANRLVTFYYVKNVGLVELLECR